MKNPEEKIKNTSEVIEGVWILLKLFWSDFKNELIEFYYISKKNLISWNKSKKIATLLMLFIFIYPMVKTYWWYIYNTYNYVVYLKNYSSIKDELSNWYEKSVKTFFNTYNFKYWVDCKWLAIVNVDSNMYEKYWTIIKSKQNCALVNRMQIYPITVENPIIDKDSKKAVISGKALVVQLNWDDIQFLWYQRYNLWKLLDWEDKDLWKINPFWKDIKIYKSN